MSLRVLHINSLLTGGGTDDRSVRIAGALMHLGHQTWIGGPAGRQFSEIAQQLKVPFHTLPLGPLKLRLILGAARFIRREGIQIVHARHGRDFWPAILAARLSIARPKVVLSRHLAKSPGSWLSRNFLLSQCDAFVAVSNFVAKVLREGDADPTSDNPERHYRPPMRGDFSKIHVVYGGFDMDQFKPADSQAQRQAWGLKPDDYAFGVVGGYDLPRGKGQPEFLKAAAIVHATVPHARFLIIGRGNMRQMLESSIEQLGLKGVAWLTPYSNDMPAAMNALDCMVLPQVGTEAIPGVVCEAHACGKPVIASNLDGIPEAFAPAGYGQLVQRGSVEELAKAMISWASKPPLSMDERQKIHEQVAERFSLDRAARDLAALYESLLESPQGRRPAM
ncbi:MAG: glycosyl transferase [Verrucomicrobia bacterium]|nr:MAG: glycosyl transferase [Verrucomicrobiota bacterium]